MNKLLQLLGPALDSLLAESPKGKGRGRNTARISTLALCGLIWWNVKDLPATLAQLDRRVVRIEARLGIADKVTDQASGAPAPSLGSSLDLETNLFSALPKPTKP